jgi:Arm domain-containing DNA-binding protein/integrase-like protein
MATIEKNTAADGTVTYAVRYRTPDRRSTRKRGFKTQRDAKAFANSVEVRKATGDYVAPAQGRVTVADLAADWLARKEQSLAASTFCYYRSTWNSHVAPRWGSTSVADIDVLAVETWVAGMTRDGHGAGTVRHAVNILSGVLEDAVKGRRPGN